VRWIKKHESTEWIKTFAIFPIRIGDEVRWLETVYYHQHIEGYDDFTGEPYYEPDKFLTKEEYERGLKDEY